MKNWEEDDGTEYCTALEDLADAKRVAATLGISLHTANFAAEYWDDVFEDFLAEYQASRTPNPDVLCNREIKFKQFADYASRLGADYIATGHYARSVIDEQGYRLLKGLDNNKDQSYFLQAVPKERLSRCLFPLGEWQKQDVRRAAESFGLHNYNRKDSTGICFIGERRFDDFLRTYVPDVKGEMIDTHQRKVGHHRGLHYYTLGQRQGLNLGGMAGRPEAPWYVVGKQMDTGHLVVTQNPCDLEGYWLRANQVNWLVTVSLPFSCQAKIRHRQADQACRVSLAADGKLLIRFENAQRAIAPGQFVALYDGDTLIAGAKIQSADPRGAKLTLPLTDSI